MSMITIKAEELKWVPYGFEFMSKDCRCQYIGFDIKARCIPFEDKQQRHPFDCLVYSATGVVQVNAKDYEEAVIARIVEMFGVDEFCIIKSPQALTITLEGFSYGKFGKVEILINADPRPHEQSYTIEVK